MTKGDSACKYRPLKVVALLVVSAAAYPQRPPDPRANVPRRLTIDQRSALLSAARAFKGQKLSIAYIGGDVEAETLAGDIAEVLQRAQWKTTAGLGISEAVFENDPSGVIVGVNHGDAQVTAAAQALLESFQSFGIASSGGNDERAAESTVRLIVGRRTPATAPFTVPILTPHTGALQADPFVCPRLSPGDIATSPRDLRSKNGTLNVELSLYGGLDIQGVKVFCFLTQDGVQAPTLRVHPGDELRLTLKNSLSPSYAAAYARTGTQAHAHSNQAEPMCAGGEINPASTNLHFHGWSIPPKCHQDDTLYTIVGPTDPPFEYRVRIPNDQAPGLYWYHPHPHGFTEPQVLGGASGALIVEGIEQKHPEVAGLPERVLVLRDHVIPGFGEADEYGAAGPIVLGKNLSVNFSPIQYPIFHPAELPVPPGTREFWRVLNASADTYFDLQMIDGESASQRLQLVALDGVGVASTKAALQREHILIPPGGRAEFIVTTPPSGGTARLTTLAYDTGPDGDPNRYRVLATIRGQQNAFAPPTMPPRGLVSTSSFASLTHIAPAQRRKLYFSEDMTNPAIPKFFVTLDGAEPKQFRMDFTKPDITVRQGTVEDWIIENRAREAHAFHIHQLHFQLLERDGKKVDEAALRDTIDLPYWDGKSAYPSVKLRMDFRSKEIVGTFVFHCHILEHEDGGMMGSIEVVTSRRR